MLVKIAQVRLKSVKPKSLFLKKWDIGASIHLNKKWVNYFMYELVLVEQYGRLGLHYTYHNNTVWRDVNAE
jgi:hypothetical protein